MSDVPGTEATPGAEAHPEVPRLILFFNYRTVFESTDFDAINFEAWKEVLDAFGYGDLSFERFLDEFALKSPAEVMQALCPFTTRAEWGPVLNKRDVRLLNEAGDLCYTEVLPIDGIKDFIIDCNRSIPTKCVFLAPFQESVARKLLEISHLTQFFDAVYGYTEREYAMLEALEVLNYPPVMIPDELHHRWEKDADPRKSGGQAQAIIMSFEVDAKGVTQALSFGIRPLGISYNCGDEDDHDATTKQNEKLLEAGASMVVKDYKSLKYEYLCHLR